MSDDIEARILALLDAGDVSGAATEAIRGYGPQILGYLTAVLRDEDQAHDVFSQFAEDLWRGLPGFRRESAVRTWGFRLAWHAASRYQRDPYRRRNRPMLTTEASKIAEEVRSTMSTYAPGGRADKLMKLRESLDPEEQTLLILRVDKGMAWEDVAEVLRADGEPVAPAALRKRFERLKEKLGRLAREQGLIE
ncbi:MAG TPA: sigma-70 family RNA polymerase sigma factor [Anaeromyxobacteraceae bacterium]|nr:sigma-70 family RNA polymerase sigma factor [Anaeromyxobacteraceae bacterium]